jgi:hypothetical protein
LASDLAQFACPTAHDSLAGTEYYQFHEHCEHQFSDGSEYHVHARKAVDAAL